MQPKQKVNIMNIKTKKRILETLGHLNEDLMIEKLLKTYSPKYVNSIIKGGFDNIVAEYFALLPLDKEKVEEPPIVVEDQVVSNDNINVGSYV